MRNRFRTGGCFCLVCGVDSRALILLFVGTLGLLVIGSVLMLVWSFARGQWDDVEKSKFKIVEAERDGSDDNP